MITRAQLLSRPPLSRLATTAAACFLLAAFWLQGVTASTHWSQTSDELPHITAGFAYNQFGDFRMHSENGNLPQRVHGLASQLLDARFPMQEDLWANSTYWQLGWDLFYGLDNRTDEIVFTARAFNALFGVVLGLFIFAVARRWYGALGGLTALAFYTFCSNFLAHSALATSDLAAALFLTLAPWFFWRHLERRDLSSGLLAGLFSGLALVAKFNGVLLAPMYAALTILDAILRRGNSPGPIRLGQNVLLAGTQALVGMLVIWSFFGFRFSAAAPDAPPLTRFAWSWDEMLSGTGHKGRVIEWLLNWQLLPEAWLYGLTNVLAGAVARPAFFAGEYSYTGWWEFFPTLFLVKTPPALLLAILIAVVAALRTVLGSAAPWRIWILRWAPLLVPALTIFVAALASNLNIGQRHILGIYPALFILAGSIAARRPPWRITAFILVGVQAMSAWSIRPHYLAYFNVIAGGPTSAYRLVVDSSLDWGQALPSLAEWLRTNRRPEEKVYLSYFGSAWPPHYDVRPTHFLPAINIARPPRIPYSLEPGLYCISATSLAEVYSDYRGPWRPQWDVELESLRSDDGKYRLYDELRFARLCKYLQSRTPDAHAGHAILIFRLDTAELAAALTGPVYGW